MSTTPDWTTFLDQAFGPGSPSDTSDDFSVVISLASNVIVGTNPPYGITDFLTMYPKWGGTPLSLTGETALPGQNQITLTAALNPVPSGLIGAPIAGYQIPSGTVIQAIDGTGTILTLSNPCSGQQANIQLTVWNAMLIPGAVILAYIALASASILQARWQEQWQVGMSLFIAHFLTLYASSEGGPTSTLGQVAAQGISTGIAVSKSAGDVSVSYQTIQGIEDWGAFNLSKYGQLLATMGRTVGSGPMLLY